MTDDDDQTPRPTLVRLAAVLWLLVAVQSLGALPFLLSVLGRPPFPPLFLVLPFVMSVRCCRAWWGRTTWMWGVGVESVLCGLLTGLPVLLPGVGGKPFLAGLGVQMLAAGVLAFAGSRQYLAWKAIEDGDADLPWYAAGRRGRRGRNVRPPDNAEKSG